MSYQNLAVQQYLRSQGDNALEALKAEYGIKHNYHTTYPNLVSLKYCQITSPKTHPIVRDCRGIILDSKNDWDVIAMGYRRFFNYGEEDSDPVDFKDSIIAEKADGSLMLLYSYNNEWMVATSGTPDANTPTSFNPNVTYQELFWEIFNNLGYKLPSDLGARSFTYMFELCSPRNPVVVSHKVDKLLFHGMRSNYTLRENLFSPEVIKKRRGWESVKWYNTEEYSSLDAVKAIADAQNGEESEGFVITDWQFNRVKIKGGDYVKIHHLKSSLSIKRILDVIRANEVDELLAVLPGLEPLVTSLVNKYESLIQKVGNLYRSGKELSDKEFALQNEGNPLRGMAFLMRKNEITSREAVRRLSDRAFERLMEIKRSDMTPMARQILDSND